MSTTNKLSIVGLLIAILGIIVSVIISDRKSLPAYPSSVKEENNNIIKQTNGTGSHIIETDEGDVNITIIND